MQKKYYQNKHLMVCIFFEIEYLLDIKGLLSNTTGAISGAGVAYPFGAPELTRLGFMLLQL